VCELNHSGITGVCLIRRVERESCECATFVLQVRYDLCGEARFVRRWVSGIDTLGAEEVDWRCFFLGLEPIDAFGLVLMMAREHRNIPQQIAVPGLINP